MKIKDDFDTNPTRVNFLTVNKIVYYLLTKSEKKNMLIFIFFAFFSLPIML